MHPFCPPYFPPDIDSSSQPKASTLTEERRPGSREHPRLAGDGVEHVLVAHLPRQISPPCLQFSRFSAGAFYTALTTCCKRLQTGCEQGQGPPANGLWTTAGLDDLLLRRKREVCCPSSIASVLTRRRGRGRRARNVARPKRDKG